MAAIKELNNQKGAALIITLLILVAVTILGMASINTSTVEMQVVRNDRVYNMNFYRAEAMLNEGAGLLKREEEARPYNLVDRYFNFMKGNSGKSFSQVKMADVTNWDLDPDGGYDNCIPFSLDNPANPVGFISAAYLGPSTGFSLSLSEPQYHDWAVFAYSNQEDGSVLHEMGFRLVYK